MFTNRTWYDYQLALVGDVKDNLALEASERDKQFQALLGLIDSIEVGGVTIPLEGSGLARDGTDIRHSNVLTSAMKQLGKEGLGSASCIPRLYWDSNGHITRAEEVRLSDTLDGASAGLPTSKAVYDAIKAEADRAKAREDEIVAKFEDGGYTITFTDKVYSAKWIGDTHTNYVSNPLFVRDSMTDANGNTVQLGYILTVSYPREYAYIAYRAGLCAYLMKNGECWFSCDSYPVDDDGNRVTVPVEFALTKAKVRA